MCKGGEIFCSNMHSPSDGYSAFTVHATPDTHKLTEQSTSNHRGTFCFHLLYISSFKLWDQICPDTCPVQGSQKRCMEVKVILEFSDQRQNYHLGFSKPYFLYIC